MREVVAFVSPTPEHAAEPVLAGIKSVRARMGLDWDVAHLAPLSNANHGESMGAKLLHKANWVVARTPHDFAMLPESILSDRRLSLICPPKNNHPEPNVCCDFNEERCGELAAHHAYECGYSRVVTIASGMKFFRRHQGFLAKAIELGLDAQIYEHIKGYGPNKGEQRMLAWFDRVKKPVAVYRPIDDAAAWLRDLLLERGNAIPQQVAIIGTGDHIVCTHREPSITSVAYPWFQMGAAAAMTILHKQRGNATPPITHLSPMRVIQRASTAQVTISDRLVKKSLTWMKKHLSAAQPAVQAAAHLQVDPSTLTRRFRKSLGRTPKQNTTVAY